MISWKELKERRITQVVLTYVAVGWVALAGVDQFADREVLPELFYRLALLVYVCGIPVALILGWFHGEKGSQRVTIPEVLLLGLVLIFTAGSGVVVTRNYQQEQRVAVPGGLNAGLDPRRVAVLYFDDLSGSTSDVGYVADGLTEALIDQLARVPELDVVSRNGVEPYRGEALLPDSIGRALNAGSVIKGSVEPVGTQVRVNVRLVDTESGVDIDRTSFTIPAEDLFAAQDSLATTASRFLRLQIGEEVRVRERRAATTSVDAWTHVQRAERLRKEAVAAYRHDPEHGALLLEQADSLLRLSEALDPAWTEPTILRAHVALRRALWSHSTSETLQALGGGVELADRVIQKEPNNARAWEARGALRHTHFLLELSPTRQERDGLLDAAQTDLETAVNLDPTLAAALNRLSGIYYYERRDLIRGALRAREALLADAYLRDAPAILELIFWASYDLGQFVEAERTCREAVGRFPQDVRFTQCQLWMMITPRAQPDPDAAWSLLARVDSLAPAETAAFDHSLSQMIVGGVLARAELPDSANRVLLDARAGSEVDPGQELPGFEAIMRTLMGDYDGALERLRRYVAANPGHRFDIDGNLHWWWRPLQNLPEFSVVRSPPS